MELVINDVCICGRYRVVNGWIKFLFLHVSYFLRVRMCKRLRTYKIGAADEIGQRYYCTAFLQSDHQKMSSDTCSNALIVSIDSVRDSKGIDILRAMSCWSSSASPL